MPRPAALLLAAFLAAAAQPAPAFGQAEAKPAAVKVGVFTQEVGRSWTTADGLPSDDVLSVAVTPSGTVYAGTAAGLARLEKDRWVAVAGLNGPVRALAPSSQTIHVGEDATEKTVDRLLVATDAGLHTIVDGNAPDPPTRWRKGEAPGPASYPWSVAESQNWGYLLGTSVGLWSPEVGKPNLVPPATETNALLGEGEGRVVRQVAMFEFGRTAVAAGSGLYLNGGGNKFQQVFPRSGKRSWSPVDVRGVAYDGKGRLWFACPEGVGRQDDNGWTLYTGEDGLPFDDFTCAAAGKDGAAWFGTTLGAIRFDGARWEYRQGRRWMPDDRVRAIAVAPNGDAYFATSKGVGAVLRQPMTLAKKAGFYEDEIDKYHRRTPFGYVDHVSLAAPGDKSRVTKHDSDNDGLWTSMYGAGECFAYAATKDPKARERAKAAFEAVRFLSRVTQGGSHPAPPGFPARSILPADGPDPNLRDSPERDRRDHANDPLWKVLIPRWPKSADGKWYWKTDTSSDELDGHYFLYAVYYDLVAETPEEKARARAVMTAITDHLLEHDFDLIDHDGTPTRWARYGPKVLNSGTGFSAERGLNSLSILSYLKVAEHVSGDPKYRAAYDRLVRDHNYAINTLEPKQQAGPGTGNQSDDEMAFMSYYNLLKYETDPALRRLYATSLRSYWAIEDPEVCPLFDYIAAAFLGPGQDAGAGRGRARGQVLSVERLAEDAEVLERFPLDLVSWDLKNSHRLDVVRTENRFRRPSGGRGRLQNGRVLPVDERFVAHWNHDPWRLDDAGGGRMLADGASFLLPYYMGLYHGFLTETGPQTTDSK
jgi:hypothetical protein